MKPRIYNRQELVNRDVDKVSKKIKEQHIAIVDSAILFWYGKKQTHIAVGDVHGRLSASLILGVLDHVKCQIQEIESG